ncbi:hypothetical protein CSA08_02030 [Candidatus Gracilibacteria bacterium]|nr:MAG: hypothetical protein CSA08_02030 [Candidatus Gracilibacteria bacterium]
MKCFFGKNKPYRAIVVVEGPNGEIIDTYISLLKQSEKKFFNFSDIDSNSFAFQYNFGIKMIKQFGLNIYLK